MLKLKVRGQVATVGNYDWCINFLMHRWGWVPARFVSVLKVELEPV